jgi:hypothetical protein
MPKDVFPRKYLQGVTPSTVVAATVAADALGRARKGC